MGARTLFFGSGDVALPALDRLLASEHVTVTAAVTAPPRPAGRKRVLKPTPVADAATQAGLPLLTPTTLRDDGVLAELAAGTPELIVLADYGRIIPPAVLDLPPHGALNIHPSLLPRHRGAAPVQATILAGDAVAGVTLMRMDAGLDTGPIVAQAEVELAGDETAPVLERRLAELGADLLEANLKGWLDGSVTARPQSADGVTLTRPLRRDDGRLDPDRPAVELERQVRAYQPWPGSYIELEGGPLKVWAASVLAAEEGRPGDPGDLVDVGDTLALRTAGGLLRLDQVQPAGKRRMRGADYRRGRRA
jgi:methionyl-tRNA formyltransferase